MTPDVVMAGLRRDRRRGPTGPVGGGAWVAGRELQDLLPPCSDPSA